MPELLQVPGAGSTNASPRSSRRGSRNPSRRGSLRVSDEDRLAQTGDRLAEKVTSRINAKVVRTEVKKKANPRTTGPEAAIRVRHVLQAVERSQIPHICYAETQIRAVHNMLASYKILSMPVKTRDSADGKGVWIGNIDVLDVLTWMMTPFTQYDGDGSPLSVEKYICNDDVMRRFEKIGTQQVKRLMNASQSNLAVPCTKETPIRDLYKWFGRAIRRCIVLDGSDSVGPPAGTPTHILSQSAVVRYLLSDAGSVLLPQASLHRSVGELGVRRLGCVVSIPDTSAVLVAFLKMVEHNVSAVAVLDKNNHVVASVGASDFPTDLKADELDDLASPVVEFLAKRYGRYRDESKTPSPAMEKLHEDLMLKSCLSSLCEQLFERQEATASMLRRLDSNGDGVLSQVELRNGLLAMGVALTGDEMDALMRTFDADGSGAVDYDEFFHIISNHRLPSGAQLTTLQDLRPSKHQPVLTCRSAATLKEVLGMMSPSKIENESKAEERKIYYRVWVVDDDDLPTGVVSYTDIFRYLDTYHEDQELAEAKTPPVKTPPVLSRQASARLSRSPPGRAGSRPGSRPVSGQATPTSKKGPRAGSRPASGQATPTSKRGTRGPAALVAGALSIIDGK